MKKRSYRWPLFLAVVLGALIGLAPSGCRPNGPDDPCWIQGMCYGGHARKCCTIRHPLPWKCSECGGTHAKSASSAHVTSSAK